MIFDYLVDFEYLARALSTMKPGDPTLDNFKRIVESCRSDGDNGRLVLDWDQKLVKPIKGVKFDPSKLGQRCQYVIMERFLNQLPACAGSRRAGIGVATPDCKRICVRAVPVFVTGYARLIERLCVIDPSPGVFVTDRDYDGDSEAVRLDDDAVFDVVDEVRKGLMRDQRVCVEESRAGALSLEEFWQQLHAFGAAETEKFEVFDPYSFDGTVSRCENLFRWIVHLLGGVNPLRSNVTVTVYSRCGLNDFTELEDLRERLVRCYRHIVGESGLSHLGSVNVRLRFRFAVEVDDTTFMGFKKDVQHDRFVATTTHYFGIGTGIDSPITRNEFNVQFKSRIRGGTEDLQLSELRDYFDSEENIRSGRVRCFECGVTA